MDDVIFENQDTVIDNNDGTETVYDPMVGTYTQSTSPWSTNPVRPYDVELQVRIGVTSRVRSEDRYRETITYTEPYNLTASTLSFEDELITFIEPVYAYFVSELNNGADVSVHVGVWMDNFTHPPTANGVVRLPKAHRDIAFTSKEITDGQFLVQRIRNIILDQKNTARY